MNRRIFLSFVVASCCCVSGVIAQEKHAHTDAPALAKFKQLAGEWVGTGLHGDKSHEVRVVYRVTAAGSAVVETIDPNGDHEMITVIHPDGDSLLLTHYCMLGNQPQMKAKPKASDDKVAFEFVKATNMKSDKDMHMHSATFTFVDKDTLKTEWTNYQDGKELEKAVFELKRKK